MGRISAFSASSLVAIAICAAATASAGATTNGNYLCEQAGASVKAAVGKAVKAEAPIQEENGACGANLPELPVIGIVKFLRRGNTVKLTVKVTKGKPNTEYKVQLAGNDPYCGELEPEVAHFKTNAHGKGHTHGAITVPAVDTEFFADVDTSGFHSATEGDTPYVSLP